ncbi:hypothetical protein HHL22_20745 [Hymenobacter sp. RP-2-7]|uniref:Uncharacterized protein n=1 Tax=Hymenobacter polaris TaxID=2682546 RepID=A0A7Y0AI57_9BACT|nr:hypothetical protein [Hymenobacter polaris]NML67637.1 hypothetical protein [Hymenobacter polaris]
MSPLLLADALPAWLGTYRLVALGLVLVGLLVGGWLLHALATATEVDEHEQPVRHLPFAVPAVDVAACLDYSEELVLNAEGELCQHYLGQPKPCSGRFTAGGQLLVRQ